nr:acyltransferase family protein [Naasia aerilata]
MSWLGFAVIAGVALFWNHPAAFPGWIAVVPVLGTMAVLVAGAPEVPWGSVRLARLRPVQWIGDASYSLYLWHLPIVGFTPYVTGQASPWYVVVGLVALTFVVAALSLRYIENPIRFRAAEYRRRKPVVLGSLASLATLTLLLSFWGIHAVSAAPA